MKVFKKISVIFLSVLFLISMLTFSTSAATSAILSFSSKTITVGDSVTVSVTINPGAPMYGVSCYVNYDENLLTFVSSSNAVGGAGVLKIVESPVGNTSVSYSMVFKAIATGNATIKVTNCQYVTDSEIDFGGASASIAIKDPALSNNANLKSLKINTGKLSPSFSASRTSYTASVSNETTQVNVTATAADAGAKVVSVTGNTNLKVGKNNVIVTVQAADGSQKQYTITVTRLKEGENVTSEPVTPVEPEEQPTDPTLNLQTQIAGTTYVIATEIPENMIFKGFKVSTEKYNDMDVPVCVDQDSLYKIYYLRAADSDNLQPYTYNKDLETFEILKYMVSGENVYIFEKIPARYAVPENLYSSNIKISDFSIDCLSSNDELLSDMHYVYCYMGGNYGIYRYDSLENTLQRYPDLVLQDINDVAKNDNLLSRFSSLSTNGKVIMICLLIAALGALALIVILVIFLIKKFSGRNEEIFLDTYEDDFDQVEEVEESEEATETEE